METEGDKHMVNKCWADKRPLATKTSKKIQPLKNWCIEVLHYFLKKATDS